MTTQILNCRELKKNPGNLIEAGEIQFKLYHKEGDPDNVNRILVKTKEFNIELFPSKGLSVGQAYYLGDPIFWDPPIRMPYPDKLDLNDSDISINGEPAPGFSFLKTLNGGIELYGMKNWGMPVEDEKTGELLPLHGETSNIPVKEVLFSNDGSTQIATIEGSFIYKGLKGDANKVWYERGEELVKAIRKVIIIYGGKPVVQVSDTFENVSKADFIIDWGYHLTFYPEDGSKLIIPSKIVEERSGSELPEDIETWRPAEKEKTRTEVGILHKSLKKESIKDTTISKILLKHISKNNLSVSFKECPYFQSWICNGGANSTEFTFTESKKPVFEKNWDGIGIELGSSALDHNGNTDPEVTISFNLKPGESYTNFIEIKVLDDEETKKLEKEIRDFQAAS